MSDQAGGHSELRVRVGGVEIAVTGESREDCLRQLEREVRALEAEAGTASSAHLETGEPGYRVTAAGAAYLAGYRDGQGVAG